MLTLTNKSVNLISLSLISLPRNVSNGLKIRKLISAQKQENSQKTGIFLEKIIRQFSTVSLSKKLYSTSTTDNETDEQQIDYDGITNGNKELEHKLKVIILEAEVMRQEGKAVPDSSFITTSMWRETLSLETRNARRRYFEYLFKISKKKENREAKKIQKRLEYEAVKEKYAEEQLPENPEDQPLKYDLKHNNIFLRFYESTMNQMYNNRLIQAMMFGQKLVIDCGYDENMTKRENVNCAKQLMLLFAENRYHDEPFDLHYCNLRRGTVLESALNKHIPTMYEPSFPVNPHECSYLDLFPKDQLVYLTPHCREEMGEFDHDVTYIIGAIVDKINNEPLSLAKAKREGIKMQKFPLDKYLQWTSGSGKSLTLNQCVSILLDVKTTGDWQHALRHVPRRKLVDFSISNNIQNTADKLRFDRDPRVKKWVPSSNTNSENVRYNKENARYNYKEKVRYNNKENVRYNNTGNVKYGRVTVKSLFDE